MAQNLAFKFNLYRYNASMETAGLAAPPKRRKLISVQCSSEYEGCPSYRHGFQLAPAAAATGQLPLTHTVGLHKFNTVDLALESTWS